MYGCCKYYKNRSICSINNYIDEITYNCKKLKMFEKA
jgi:hypothetical protein